MIPGAIYGQGYHELDSHCFAYIHATEVGGTHPALIEAMGRGALVLYRDTPENAEVAGDAGIPFGDDLAAKIEQALAMSEADREALRQRARERVARRLLLGCGGHGLRKSVPVDNEIMPPPYRSYVLVSLDRIARNYRNVRAAVGTGRRSDGGREGRRLRARRAGGIAHADRRGREMAGRQLGGRRRDAARWRGLRRASW